jgi:hypothetical protein
VTGRSAVVIRQYKVSEPEWGETYFVSPHTGDLLVVPTADLPAPTARKRLSRLGIDPDADEWTRDPFQESRPSSMAVDKGWGEAFADWEIRERRALKLRWRFMRLSSLAIRALRSQPWQERPARHTALRAIKDAGEGPKDQCLVTSLVQAAFLVRCGVPCTVWIGCWTPTIDMHAWVSVADAGDPKSHCLVSEPLERVSLYRPSIQFDLHPG